MKKLLVLMMVLAMMLVAGNAFACSCNCDPEDPACTVEENPCCAVVTVDITVDHWCELSATELPCFNVDGSQFDETKTFTVDVTSNSGGTLEFGSTLKAYLKLDGGGYDVTKFVPYTILTSPTVFDGNASIPVDVKVSQKDNPNNLFAPGEYRGWIAVYSMMQQ